MDGGGSIASGYDSRDTNNDDIDEEVFAILSMSGIIEGLKIRRYGFDVDEFGHGSDLGGGNADTVAGIADSASYLIPPFMRAGP